jgi:hypothetical protein
LRLGSAFADTNADPGNFSDSLLRSSHAVGFSMKASESSHPGLDKTITQEITVNFSAVARRAGSGATLH